MAEPIYGNVSIDDIVEIGATVPTGRYCVRALSVDGKLSKNSNPMLVVAYEVMQGDEEGKEATCYYTLMASKGKDGRTYSGGLSELRKIFAAVGKPLPAKYEWQLGNPAVPNSTQKSMDTYRKMFMEKVGQQKLEMPIKEDRTSPRKDKDTGEPVMDEAGNQLYNMRRTIVGPWNREGGAGQFSDLPAANSGVNATATTGSTPNATDIANMLAGG